MIARLTVALAASAAVLVSTPAALAQTQGPAAEAAAPEVTPAALEAALDEIARLVRERYFDAAKRPAVLDALAAARRNGRYARIDPRTLANRVSDDLKRVTNDGHMSLRWDPERYRARLASAGSSSRPPDPSYFNEQIRRGHHGLQEMRILPGNVRYVKISSLVLYDFDTSPAAYDGAMRFLKDADAMIIDLRGNGGGFAEASEYLLSYLLPPDVLLHTSVEASKQLPAFSARELPEDRLIGKPLYVLIDRSSASATEAVALSVDRFKLGELIGETTAGAGNRNGVFTVAPGFLLSVSTAAVRHGLDGSGWEGVGVTPHVKAASAEALEVAHTRALEKLARSGPELRRAEYRWHAETVRAKLNPPTLSEAELARYAGRYGDRTVTLRSGKLFSKREDGPELLLTPMTADTFIVGTGDLARLRFESAQGKVMAATLIARDGENTRQPREDAS